MPRTHVPSAADPTPVRTGRARGPRHTPKLLLVGLAMFAASSACSALPDVPVPPENPITEPKRMLGKVLFWDEQLSSSNSMACGTCHMPERGGADPRQQTHPGVDLTLNTSDDVFGSPGVIRSDGSNRYRRDATFGLGARVTTRIAPSAINAAFFDALFWDGRAGSTFNDPLTGLPVLDSKGALESQSAGPPLSEVEMSHQGRTWTDLAVRVAASRPLALAAALPADVEAALADRPSYPELFWRAFGDAEVTPARIAMAIATYERTLVSDLTPWDRWKAGEAAAMTANQIAGWIDFNNRACVECHATPLFSDGSFRNIGVDPPSFDRGRESVTGLASDRGRFKVPSLRNIGLRRLALHDGSRQGVASAVQFYQNPASLPPGSPRHENRDPLMDTISLNGNEMGRITDFLANGLTDPRVAAAQFPFDRPVLAGERAELRPQIISSGRTGSGGIAPRLFIESPARVGMPDFRAGVDGVLGGAAAQLVLSRAAPDAGVVSPDVVLDATTADGSGPGAGVATAFWNINPRVFTDGDVVFLQWRIADPSATDGVALSQAVSLMLFCGGQGCPPTPCGLADVTGVGGPPAVADDQLTVDDLIAFVNAFMDGANCPDAPGFACSLADITDIGHTGEGPDGQLTVDDLIAYINAFGDGC